MRPHGRVSMLLVASAMALAGVDAGYADEQHQCFFESIQATFTAETSTYHVEAGCMYYHPLEGPVPAQRLPIHWSSQGSFDSRTGLATEDVTFKGSSGIVTTTLSCPSDPWLNPSTLPGMIRCKNPTFKTSGVDPTLGWFRHLREGFYSLSTIKVGPLPNSTGFPYNRASLIAQRDAALKAAAAEAAAALARTNKRIQQGVMKGPPVVVPTILLPTPGQSFLNQTTVPIKLSPPQGWADTQVGLDGKPLNTGRLYAVRVERRAPDGSWIPHTTLPVGAPQAESATGYTGFGAGTPPGGITSPGSWRLSAQMSSPSQTGWSGWVEFLVMAPPTGPNSTVQRAPKMFGP
ncbi:hypothetical protein YTPLAS18_07400 [Nitrospira sp.]|nr:hypothetical protein YTPLAS18_07400 [Nitrospira sp.]